MYGSNPMRVGQERHVVSMFVDMRGSTRMAEKRLPFDTMFIVNRFVARCRRRSWKCGRPNQFVGDGMLALFGLRPGCSDRRQALHAVSKIAVNVDS